MADQTDVHRNLYDDLEFKPFNPTKENDPEFAKEFFPVHREPPIETMDKPVIIEAACPGWQPAGDHYPAVPTNPEETTEELIDCVKAGAAAIHVHPRDENGIPQIYGEETEILLTEVVDPVFEECGDVLTLQHTWSGGTPGNYHIDYVTGAQQLLEMGDGNKYCQGALILPPGRGNATGYHSRDSILEGLRFYQENDIKPIFQLYDSHVVQDLKRQVFEKGEVDEDDAPHIMNINAGKHHSHAIHKNPWSFLQILSAMGTVEETIENSIINVYPGGRNWLAVYVFGLLAGGTVFRIGVEDAYWKYPHKDELIQKNSEIVELAVNIAEQLGREVITDFDEARDHLGIKYTSPR